MSSATDHAPEAEKAKRWSADKAMEKFHERRRRANEMRKARAKGDQITLEEYKARKTATGRPPKYKPEYCETLIKLSEEGKSITAIAGELKVRREQLYVWAQRYPAFGNAMQIAKPVRVNALETSMLSEDSGPRINARIFALKNAAPEEWSDRQNIEINQTVNVAVTFSNVLDGLCGKVIEGVLQDDAATQSNDINRLLPQTHDAGFETGLIETGLRRSGLVETGLDSVTETGGRLPPTADHLEPVDIEYTSSPSTEPPSSSAQPLSKKIQKKQNDARLKKAAYQREYMRKRRAAARTRSVTAPSDSEGS